MKKRLNPEDRKEHILQAAVTVAGRDGFLSLKRDDVAREANVSPGLVTRYFYCADELKRQVMRRAVHDQNLRIIAEGLAIGDSIARSAPDELRVAAALRLGA